MLYAERRGEASEAICVHCATVHVGHWNNGFPRTQAHYVLHSTDRMHWPGRDCSLATHTHTHTHNASGAQRSGEPRGTRAPEQCDAMHYERLRWRWRLPLRPSCGLLCDTSARRALGSSCSRRRAKAKAEGTSSAARRVRVRDTHAEPQHNTVL